MELKMSEEALERDEIQSVPGSMRDVSEEERWS